MAHVFQTFDKNGRAHKCWRFQYTDCDGRRRKGKGTSSKADTEKLAQRVQAQQDFIRKGYIPRPTIAMKPRPFEKLAAEYIAWGRRTGRKDGGAWTVDHADKREEKLRWWRNELRLELVSDLVGCHARVEACVRRLLSENIADDDSPPRFRTPQTVQRYQDAIVSFCGWAFMREYLDDNPLKRLKSLPRVTQNVKRALTLDEIEKLLSNCNPARRLLYQMALASGLRANELRSLTVAHVDFDRGGIRLEKTWTKNRRPGFQYLAVGIMEQLRAVAVGLNPSDSILNVGEHTARDLDADLPDDVKKWGPGGKIDFHALRTTYSTLVDEAGATPKENMDLMRHSTVQQTFGTYTKSREHRLVELAEIIGEAVAPAPILHQQKIVGAESAGGVMTSESMAGVHRNESDPAEVGTLPLPPGIILAKSGIPIGSSRNDRKGAGKRSEFGVRRPGRKSAPKLHQSQCDSNTKILRGFSEQLAGIERLSLEDET